jgi:succinyl-CoA synthetase alpha subunit
MKKVIVREDTYRDSVILMRLSNAVSELDGVAQAGVVMGTPTNKEFLKVLDLLSTEAENASPNDLIIALDTRDEETMQNALAEVDILLKGKLSHSGSDIVPKTLDFALREMHDANLVVISVPGTYAKREALKALNKGLNVFLFSSNVSLEDELELKLLAQEKGLLCMGPDCGTAIINNKVLGFGNVIRKGGIGLVAAAGTGLQEVSTLIHDGGYGISQAIGIGGNDLSNAVGGIMMIESLRLLEEDDNTEVIVLISKPPHPEVSERIINIVSKSHKPVVINFLGSEIESNENNNYITAKTLEDAANVACGLMKKSDVVKKVFTLSEDEILSIAEKERSKMSLNQKYLRALYSGGTLSYEAMILLQPLIGDTFSNSPMESHLKLADYNLSKENTCVDMGAEEFIIGRPHPMIDYTLRNQRIIREAEDPETSVILLDVVLGFGSHINPAKELMGSLKEAIQTAEDNGRYLSIIASIVGTDLDPQNFDEQYQALKDAGVIIMPSNAQAVRLAALIASKGNAKSIIFKEML